MKLDKKNKFNPTGQPVSTLRLASALMVPLLALALWPAAAVGDSGEDHPCGPPFGPGEEVGTISDPEIDESSGLADSWLHDNRLWTHNDSGDQPRLWAMDKQGQVTTEVAVVGADNIDWEDMAIAPCAADDTRPCIYVADFGDNNSIRDQVVIYRFPEPDLGDEPPATFEIHQFETLTYQYDSGPRDAESLLVHPETRQLWVIEKTGHEEVLVFEIPESFDNDEPHIVSPVATLHESRPAALLRMIVAADIAPDGSEFTYRTYAEAVTHCVTPGEDFATAFDNPPVRRVIEPGTIQGEALTYDRGDLSLWLTSEQLPAPLIRLPPRLGEDPEGDDEPESEGGDVDEAEPDHDVGIGSPQESNAGQSGCSTASPAGPTSRALLLLIALLPLTRPDQQAAEATRPSTAANLRGE